MPKRTIRFAVSVSGRPSVFLTAIETATQKLRLILRTGAHFGEATDPGAELTLQKYSIHYGEKSPDYSMLHFTMVGKDGRKFEAHQLTDVLKKQSGFAFMYAGACMDLSPDFFAVRPGDKSEIVIIDRYDPKVFTFCYGLAIGPPGAEFAPTPKGPINILQFAFGQSSLSFLWSFASMRSSVFSSFGHAATLPPESARSDAEAELFRWRMKGISADQCQALFFDLRQKAMYQNIDKFVAWTGMDDRFKQRLRILTGHVRTANTEDPYYVALLGLTGAALRKFDASFPPKIE
jgi:hypothetical protein